MQFDAVNALLEKYRDRLSQLDKTTHPNDDMLKKSPKGWDDYETVGRSSVEWIAKALLFCKTQRVRSVLDFGSGHGRVARHIRLMLPDARMTFSDIDDEAWRFCARQFGGDGFASVEDFRDLKIPGKYDLIFLGSVFTHLSWDRSVTLWRKLFDSLEPGGAMIATFRGAMCHRIMLRDAPRLNMGGYYDPMLADYRATGFGYQDYKGFSNWGQNLFTPGKIAELADGAPNAQLAMLSEAAWANIHDLGVWTRI